MGMKYSSANRTGTQTNFLRKLCVLTVASQGFTYQCQTKNDPNDKALHFQGGQAVRYVSWLLTNTSSGGFQQLQSLWQSVLGLLLVEVGCGGHGLVPQQFLGGN